MVYCYSMTLAMEDRVERADASAAASLIARRLFDSAPMPALSLAVADGGGTLWAEAFGKADLEFDVDATTGHVFRLGSVSKAVTATAAARLVTRGMLDLDVPIAYWLPDLPAHHRATTMRQLLTHRGGVRHYGPGDLDDKSPGGRITKRAFANRDEILALFIDDPLVGPPGGEVSYSSFGYTLASFVMEAAGGTDFLRLVMDEVALPFGLPSLAADEVLEIVPLRARGYFAAQEFEFIAKAMGNAERPALRGAYANVTLSNPAFCWAGAGLMMTMPDLARFGAAHLDWPQSRISAEERALLFTPMTEASDKSPPLGLGWRVDHDAQGRLRWHHAGSTPGGRASLVVYPDLGLSIALASNVMMAPGDVLGPSAELADAIA
jgi:CubicO group peptidase (beta-lactamase class C family)